MKTLFTEEAREALREAAFKMYTHGELMKMSAAEIKRAYQAAYKAHMKVAMSDPEGNKRRATYLKQLKAAWEAAKEEKRAVRR